MDVSRRPKNRRTISGDNFFEKLAQNNAALLADHPFSPWNRKTPDSEPAFNFVSYYDAAKWLVGENALPKSRFKDASR